jgi:hypothetical protein
VFHVELRQFPHQARAFNLTREELDARILERWVAGAVIELDDRRWSPERARLTIYEGPRLAPEDLGMGRGWGNVTRDGSEVTERLLAEVAHPTPVAELKDELIALLADGPLPLTDVVALAAERYPRARVSECVALCEQAVWELLHVSEISLIREGAPVARGDWQATLLSWAAWRDEGLRVARA